MGEKPSARLRAELALCWATGMAIAHVVFTLDNVWSPIMALFLIGGYYGIKSIVTNETT